MRIRPHETIPDSWGADPADESHDMRTCVECGADVDPSDCDDDREPQCRECQPRYVPSLAVIEAVLAPDRRYRCAECGVAELPREVPMGLCAGCREDAR